ncbi:MAG TPA: tetratricopeptide repeat protein [Planctomycetaceae bacterium]|nr:tetratricopeptide repeat protein [Planctomycetaceae bacterium]
MQGRIIPARSGTRRRRACGHPSATQSLSWIAVLICGLCLARPVAAASLAEAEKLFRTGEYAKCAEMTGLAIAEGEFSEQWRLLKIRSELELGRYTHALESLEEAKKKFAYSIQLLWLEREVRRFNGQSAKADAILADVASLIERQSWRFRDSDSVMIIGQFFMEIGADAKQVRNEIFSRVQKDLPSYTGAYIAGAELALEKHDYALAAEDFQKALKIDEDDPRIHFGLARAFGESDSELAETHLNRAIEINPNHIPSLLMAAEEQIDAERYEKAEEFLEQVLEVNPRQPKAWAYRAVLSHLENDPKKETLCREQALANWKDNPEVDHLIGRMLSQKYRFAEGAEAQRRALAFDSDFLPAKMQLCNDLLRLGDVDAGWKLADEVFERDNYNVVAHNLTTLRDRMAKFRTLKSDGFVVRMDSAEAEIYGPRVLELLRVAKQDLTEKYQIELDETIAIEIFPRQQDFAIRTFGLPGGAGFLGVCFGSVVTMNSPASQGASPSNWEAVLWHEFCHVVTLSKTHNKMPRWLSEGISVYEEGQKNRAWGQSMTPEYREMILGEDLTPVSQLSGAFLSPPSAEHLQFAYYESSLVVEYLVDRFGLEALIAILDDLGTGLQINDAIARHAAPLEEIDADFTAFARELAEAYASEADFDREELPRTADSEGWKAWLAEHPDNFWGLQQYAMALIREKQWEAAKEPIARLMELAPDYSESTNAFLMQARVSRELGETDREIEVLEQLAALNADVIDVYLRLAELHADREDWESVIVNANRLLAVNPLLPDPHRFLAEAGERAGDAEAAIVGLRALSRMNPFDPADIHYRAARLLHQTGQFDEARQHVLLALAEAPRYREAHELLLEVVDATSRRSDANNYPEPPPLPE